MIIIGIDPGLRGAVAVLHEEGWLDQRAHLRRNIRFCITPFQTMSCIAMEKRAEVMAMHLTACSKAFLSRKSTRKPVQQIKIKLMGQQKFSYRAKP